MDLIVSSRECNAKQVNKTSNDHVCFLKNNDEKTGISVFFKRTLYDHVRGLVNCSNRLDKPVFCHDQLAILLQIIT